MKSITKQNLLKIIENIPKTIDETYINQVIVKIHSLFDETRFCVTTTKNLRLSRKVSLDFILKNRLKTCGSLATVLAYVLSQQGFSVILVDGKLKRDKKWHRHGWLKVKIGKNWQSFDPFSTNFVVNSKTHKVLGFYTSWRELEIKKQRR